MMAPALASTPREGAVMQQTTDLIHHFASELATNPAVVAKLLAEHAADENGMCVTCTTGGTGIHETSFPCGVRMLADIATETIAVQERQLPVQRR